MAEINGDGPDEAADSRSLEPWAAPPDPNQAEVEASEKLALERWAEQHPATSSDQRKAAADDDDETEVVRRLKSQRPLVAEYSKAMERLNAGLHQLGKSRMTAEEADAAIEAGLAEQRARKQATDEGGISL